MNFDQAYAQATDYLRADIPTGLWGHPGIGKSALGKLLAQRFNLEFLDIRLGQIEPIDLNGFVHKNEATGTFDYLPWARFPLESTPLPEGKQGWLIMFDEINTAPRQNLAAAYRFILDRMVGQQKLHPRCRLMMGGNLVGEGLAGALPSPLVSRAAHITLDVELTPDLRRILGPSISRFLENHPKHLYQATPEPNTPFPTPRTWEMVRRYLDAVSEPTLAGISGIVGTGAAVAYFSFRTSHQALQDLLPGDAMFPLEHAQDLLDFLSPADIETHLHRFPGEWITIARVAVENAAKVEDLPF